MQEAAEKALQIDDQVAEGHSVLGRVLYSYRRDWADSEREFQHALQLDPGDANTHQWYAQYLCLRGKHEAAEAEIIRGLKVDPLSSVLQTQLAETYY